MLELWPSSQLHHEYRLRAVIDDQNQIIKIHNFMQDLLKYSCFQGSKKYFQITTNWLNTTNGNDIKQHSFFELLNL